MRSFSIEISLSLLGLNLTVLYHDPEEERLIEVEDEEKPDEADAVLLDQGLHLPVDITEGVLEEASNVLERSPLLSHIAGLSSGSHELAEVTISLLGQRSTYERISTTQS
jgi:hypothetical protein